MGASHDFMRNANLKYDRRMRKLNNPTQSPINFAFTTNYDDDSVPINFDLSPPLVAS
jgi:hypothetical protein